MYNYIRTARGADRAGLPGLSSAARSRHESTPVIGAQVHTHSVHTIRRPLLPTPTSNAMTQTEHVVSPHDLSLFRAQPTHKPIVPDRFRTSGLDYNSTSFLSIKPYQADNEDLEEIDLAARYDELVAPAFTQYQQDKKIAEEAAALDAEIKEVKNTYKHPDFEAVPNPYVAAIKTDIRNHEEIRRLNFVGFGLLGRRQKLKSTTDGTDGTDELTKNVATAMPRKRRRVDEPIVVQPVDAEVEDLPAAGQSPPLSPASQNVDDLVDLADVFSQIRPIVVAPAEPWIYDPSDDNDSDADDEPVNLVDLDHLPPIHVVDTTISPEASLSEYPFIFLLSPSELLRFLHPRLSQADLESITTQYHQIFLPR